MQSDRAPVAIGMWSSAERPGMRSPLFQRMLMLLHCPFRVEQRPPRRWSWSLRLVVFVASLASACLCIRWPHAAALEQRRTADARSRREPFRVADFVAARCVFTPGGRSLPYHMPVALPSHFDLDSRGPLEHERPGEDSHRRTSPDRPVRPEARRDPSRTLRCTPNPGIKSASSARARSFHSGSMARKIAGVP